MVKFGTDTSLLQIFPLAGKGYLTCIYISRSDRRREEGLTEIAYVWEGNVVVLLDTGKFTECSK